MLDKQIKKLESIQKMLFFISSNDMFNLGYSIGKISEKVNVLISDLNQNQPDEQHGSN